MTLAAVADVGLAQPRLTDPPTYSWPDAWFNGWQERNGEWSYEVRMVSTGTVRGIQTGWRTWFVGQSWKVRPGGWEEFLGPMSREITRDMQDYDWEEVERVLGPYVDLMFVARNDRWSAKVFSFSIEMPEDPEVPQEVLTVLSFSSTRGSLYPPASVMTSFQQLPQYPKCEEIVRMALKVPEEESFDVLHVTYNTSDEVSQVVTWYVEALRGSGWHIQPMFSMTMAKEAAKGLYQQGLDIPELSVQDLEVEIIRAIKGGKEWKFMFSRNAKEQVTEISCFTGSLIDSLIDEIPFMYE